MDIITIKYQTSEQSLISIQCNHILTYVHFVLLKFLDTRYQIVVEVVYIAFRKCYIKIVHFIFYKFQKCPQPTMMTIWYRTCHSEWCVIGKCDTLLYSRFRFMAPLSSIYGTTNNMDVNNLFNFYVARPIFDWSINCTLGMKEAG